VQERIPGVVRTPEVPFATDETCCNDFAAFLERTTTVFEIRYCIAYASYFRVRFGSCEAGILTLTHSRDLLFVSAAGLGLGQ
jgi:hypothetical protein